MRPSETTDIFNGIIGDLITGSVMVLVLVITLVVQYFTNKRANEARQENFDKQVKTQADHFAKQMAATTAIADRQFGFERASREADLIHSQLPKLLEATFEIQRIGETGQGRDEFTRLQYMGLAAIRLMKTVVRPEAREQVVRVNILYDRVVTYVAFISSQSPATKEMKTALTTYVGAFLGVVTEWVEAYVDGDDQKRAELIETADANIEAADEALRLMGYVEH